MTDVNLKSHPPLSFLTSPACEGEKCKKTRHHLPELSASATSQGVTCFLWCSESASHSLSPKIRESGQRVRVHEGRELRARGEKKRRERRKAKSSVDVCNLIPDAIGSRTSFVLSFITQCSISLFGAHCSSLAMVFLLFPFADSRVLPHRDVQMHSLSVVIPMQVSFLPIFCSDSPVTFLTLVTDASCTSSASHCISTTLSLASSLTLN